MKSTELFLFSNIGFYVKTSADKTEELLGHYRASCRPLEYQLGIGYLDDTLKAEVTCISALHWACKRRKMTYFYAYM